MFQSLETLIEPLGNLGRQCALGFPGNKHTDMSDRKGELLCVLSSNAL